MYSLLCKPIFVPQTRTIQVRECKVVNIKPTIENKFEMEILEAPTINVTKPEDTHKDK
jgi:hypothetical protein